MVERVGGERGKRRRSGRSWERGKVEVVDCSVDGWVSDGWMRMGDFCVTSSITRKYDWSNFQDDIHVNITNDAIK